eukprot:3601728-Amphidinium_carterae.1
MAAIFVLDKVDDDFMKNQDGQATGEGARIITTVVDAISILVGFSWEHSFDGSVEVISKLTDDPLLAETVLALIVGFLIVPSWRRFILRRAMQLQEYKEKGAAAAASSIGPQE